MTLIEQIISPMLCFLWQKRDIGRSRFFFLVINFWNIPFTFFEDILCIPLNVAVKVFYLSEIWKTVNNINIVIREISYTTFIFVVFNIVYLG